MEAYKLETTITKDAKIECELPPDIAHLRLKKVDIIIIPKKTPEEILQGAKMLRRAGSLPVWNTSKCRNKLVACFLD